MDILQALILGIVEGITEFLPISSTGHLILTSHLLGIASTDFVKSFEIFIQLGAITSVVALYWRDFLQTKLWPQIIAGFLPTAILGFIFYPLVKSYLLGNVSVTLAALVLGGLVLIFLHWITSAGNQPLTPRRALGIGLFQAISMIPGVSRSAATIVGGMLLGVSKQEAVKFSFLLAVPTMLAATTLDLVRSSFSFTTIEWTILATGFIAAFITALLAIKFFIKYVQAHSLASFGVYRIILAAGYFMLLIKTVTP